MNVAFKTMEFVLGGESGNGATLRQALGPVCQGAILNVMDFRTKAVLKVMDFEPRMVDFEPKVMDFEPKVMDFEPKVMDFIGSSLVYWR